MAPKNRALWSGEPELVDIIAEFAVEPNFVKYGEAMTAPLQINKILPLRGMWRQLKARVPNLSFVQSALEKTMLQVYVKVKVGWRGCGEVAE